MTIEIEKYVKQYTGLQKENWKRSKKIELYKDISQFNEFVEKAKNRENAGKKLYFGMVADEIADLVKKKLDLDIKNFNCALYSDNIRKIFKDHGDEIKENLRGQRAVLNKDLFLIPKIIGCPDEVEFSGYYNKFPVIKFKKDDITIVAVISEGVLDLYTQTMYIRKKNRSLATATDEQASVYTPETTRSTASNNSIYQNIKNTIDFFKMMKLYKTICFCYDI